MKRFVLFIALLTLSACATTHPGKMGASLKNSNIPLKISAQKVDQKENEAFQLVDVTIENISDIWLKIHSVRVVIKDPSMSKVSVVMGRDLKDWALAMEARMRAESYNKNVAMMGLAAVGAAATAYGLYDDKPEVAVAGAAALVGAGAWAATNQSKSSLKKATTSDTLPNNHLYQSFSVPAKMFARRWVLLNKPSDQIIDKILLDVETVEGEKDTYEIVL
jgi:hypothetical protein